MKLGGIFVFQEVKILPGPQQQPSLKEKVKRLLFNCVDKHWAKLGDLGMLQYFSSHWKDEGASGRRFGKVEFWLKCQK